MAVYPNQSPYSKRAKYSKLSSQTQQELLSEFCEALLSLRNTNEAVKFLIDLLTKSEALMLAKRIKIAKLLLEGRNYRQIENQLKVSHGTITKVAEWLTEGGEGFRIITKRTSKKSQKKTPEYVNLSQWSWLKRQYPSMFWPQLLIEEIIQSANKRQKQKISTALKKLDQKSKIYKDINRVLKKYC